MIKDLMRYTAACAVSYFCLFLSGHVQAQKLPKVQKNSIVIPDNCMVDGKATEWDDKFQAYNQATEIYYTIANDDKNLYLVVKTENPAVSNKIMQGGVTFSIASDGDKDIASGSAITYPVVKPADMRRINQEIYGVKNTPDGKMSGEEFMRRRDSAMAAVSRKLIFVIKEIKIAALNGITDSTLSIYNEYGVKASLSIDGQNHLTYEMQVPLERLKITANPATLSYNIRLNGPHLEPRKLPANVKIDGAEGGGNIVVVRGVGQVNPENLSPKMAEMIALSNPTFFWGEYTLVKK